jgi:ABC-type lipoprotein export system ATPase subunit
MSQLSPVPVTPPRNSPPRAILRASGLNKEYQMGDSVVQVLRDAELTVAEGEFVAIEGRSGSGKSTLLHILGALDAVDSGNMAFNSIDYTRYTPVERNVLIRGILHPWTSHSAWLGIAFGVALLIVALIWKPVLVVTAFGIIALSVLAHLLRMGVALAMIIQKFPEERAAARLRNRDFGFVFQFYHLLPELNVLENAMLSPMIQNSWLAFFGQRRAIRERATAVLHELGMAHRLSHRPNQLSGGERQRVAIARALMNEPKVLFADEPTGNLDAETGKQIMAVLERLHREKGQTIVMVTHDRGLARKTDRVLVLRNGKLEPAEH